MKQTICFFFFLGLMAITFSSCQKDAYSSFEGLRVHINGTSWTAPKAGAAYHGSKISITGIDSEALKLMAIKVPSYITPGTYPMQALSAVECGYTLGLDNTYAPTIGTLVITEHNTVEKRIKGTFLFEGVSLLTGEHLAFTEGEFNVGYEIL